MHVLSVRKVGEIEKERESKVESEAGRNRRYGSDRNKGNVKKMGGETGE